MSAGEQSAVPPARRHWPWRLRFARAGRLALAVLLVGVAAGSAGAALTALLHLVQHVTFGYDGMTFLRGVEQATFPRRVIGPALGGLLAGFAWWALRAKGAIPGVRDLLAWPRRRRLPARTLGDALAQISAVGAGMSVGREAAPRQAAAALALPVARWFRLPDDTSRLLVGAAAGAGLAAVYNVPISGVVFACALLRKWSPRAVAVSAGSCSVATVVAWPVVGPHAVYGYPALAAPEGGSWLCAVATIPVSTVIAVAFGSLCSRARASAVEPSWLLPPALCTVGAVLGATSWWYPELPGNGKGVVEVTLGDGASTATFVVLMLAKPLVTALCLRSGAVGGLLTPSMATGAAVGGTLWGLSLLSPWPADLAPVSLAAAASVLAVTQRNAVFAAALVVEMSRPPWQVLLMTAGCAALSRVLAEASSRSGGLRSRRRP